MPQLNVRMTAEDKALIARVCRARGEAMSSFVRRVLRQELAALGFLTIEEKKALGLNPPGRLNNE